MDGCLIVDVSQSTTPVSICVLYYYIQYTIWLLDYHIISINILIILQAVYDEWLGFIQNIKSCSHLCDPGSEFTDDLSECPGVLVPVNAQVKGYSFKYK